ncbi:MAG: N-acetyltransferase [Coriobacteriales bacterium]|nr:N-acetyltransferase [Coriobacteriales bacterium]
MTIRTVAPSDPRVGELLRAAFPTDEEAKLVSAVAVDAPALVDGLSIGAFEGECLLGYVLFTRVWVGPGSAQALSLAPLGVHPEAQGRGIGRLLVLDGLRRARNLGECAVIVLGYPEYYTRFGFEPVGVLGIEAPWPDVPAEAWLGLDLDPGALGRMNGVVQYAAAFNEVV